MSPARDAEILTAGLSTPTVASIAFDNRLTSTCSRRGGMNAQVLVGRVDINRHFSFLNSVDDNLHAVLDTAIDRNTLQVDRAFSGKLLQLPRDSAQPVDQVGDATHVVARYNDLRSIDYYFSIFRNGRDKPHRALAGR